MYQNLQDMMKAVLRRGLVLSTCVEKPKINNLMIHLRTMDKEQPKYRIKKEMKMALTNQGEIN